MPSDRRTLSFCRSVRRSSVLNAFSKFLISFNLLLVLDNQAFGIRVLLEKIHLVNPPSSYTAPILPHFRRKAYA